MSDLSMLNPVIAAYIAPFAPATRRPATIVTRPQAPPLPSNLFAFEWGEEELSQPLVCHLEHHPGASGAREWETGLALEPDQAERCSLWAAYIGDVDISPLLHPEQIQNIEAAALAQRNKDHEP